MYRVVFDSSVYISAFAIPGSLSERAFLYAIEQRFLLFVSTAILAEIGQKLQDKFSIPQEDIVKALRNINDVAVLVKPKTKLAIVADETDNRILECAMTAKADLVVTGDKHLLRIKRLEHAGIVRVADFLHILS